MRTEKKVAIIVATALMLVGISMISVSVSGAGLDYKKLVKTENYEEKTYDISEGFNNIELSIGSNDVIIKKSDDSNAHFTCGENEKIVFEVGVKAGTLTIEEKSVKPWTISFNLDITPIDNVLYLPKDSYDQLSASLGSGDITIDHGFDFSELALKIGSGDINVSNVKCQNKFSADTSSGRITVAGTTSDGSFYSRTGSGKINLSSCEGVTLEAKTGSGSITVSDCDATSINMHTGSGDITGTLRTGKKFDVHAGSGDVRVPSDSGTDTCTIKTGSGDIEISVIQQ
jgi:DUF4097 and DUF4098 domain-containing protein YvlB